MKRGLRRAYLDSKTGDLIDLLDEKRRPSRIEERIRMRRSCVNKSPESLITSSSLNGGNSSVSSCDSSSSQNTNSANSCSSSSNENFPKNRDSKQRVDLFELQASNRTSFNHVRLRKLKVRSKINREKLSSLFNGRSKIKARAKSAPCTPLFSIKYGKNNCSNHEDRWGGTRNFVDYKIVEKDCIIAASEEEDQETQITDKTTNDDKPIGNPALISIMTDSLDKIKKKLKSSKSRDEIIGCSLQSEKSNDSNLHSSSNETCSDNKINEMEQNSDSHELEISLNSSRSPHELRSNESPGEKHQVEEPQECFTNAENQEPNSKSTNDKVCTKSFKECQTCGRELSIEETRINSTPKNLVRVGIDRCDSIGHQGKEISCGSTSQLNNCGRSSSALKKYRTGNNHSCLEKSRDLFLDAKASFGSVDLPRSSENCVEGNCRLESRGRFLNSNPQRICTCEIYATKFDYCSCSNFNTVTKYNSCYYCNRSTTKCCNKICAYRSKSIPRKVTFRLPSLIPEEETSCQSGEDKTVESSSRIICKCGRIGCFGIGKLKKSLADLEKNEFLNSVLKDSKKSDQNAHRNIPRLHDRGCKFHRKSRSPRVHFCRRIITTDQDIVCRDFVNREEKNNQKSVENFESRVSVESAEEWAVDSEEDNSNSFDNISFPKETRQAMNVLLQSRVENTTPQRQVGDLNPQGSILEPQPRREQLPARKKEVKVSKKPDLEVFDTTEHKAMHVASYARALAVFQRTCDPLQEGGSCKKKRHTVWKGSDGEIHSECIIGARELTLGNLGNRVKNCNRRRNTNNSNHNHRQYYQNFLRSNSKLKLDPNPRSSRRTFDVPQRSTGLASTMQTNGSENGSSENGVDRTGWTVGLINGRFKYLTAETFGFKINANGASLKKKQLWTLEGSEHQVFLRSHLDRYLAVDQFGNVTCEAEDTADPGCAFQIQVASDGSGRWALKNIQRGYFLGSSQDELKCTAKVPGDAEYWLVHLAARPQVNLRSAGRKRFAHLSAAQDEIHVDAPVPWGEDTLFTLEFRPSAMPDNIDGNGDVRRDVRSEAGIGGHYALHTCNNKYLARDGKLLDSCTRDCLYAAEFHAGMLALRDVSGAYLAPIGSKAVLKSRSNTVTRDELFSLEDSLPQASFVAALNQRYVSVKQGVDVTANQDEISGHETFQLEFDRATKRWYLRTMQDRYWTLEAGGGIQASDHKRSSNALFDLVWQPADGTVALRANNGKFLATKRSGHLYANADSPGDSEASKFYFYLMNRPVLVLRCEQGFVGLKSNASPKLECNKASYETIRVERCDRGIVRFKGQNGKYWHADSEGVTSDADVPSDGFYLELREPSRICIKSTDGRYLSAGKNGVFRLGDTDYESATKWEF